MNDLYLTLIILVIVVPSMYYIIKYKRKIKDFEYSWQMKKEQIDFLKLHQGFKEEKCDNGFLYIYTTKRNNDKISIKIHSSQSGIHGDWNVFAMFLVDGDKEILISEFCNLTEILYLKDLINGDIV